VAAKPENKPETATISEMVVMNYTDNKADSLAALAKKARDKAAVPLESKLTGKVDGLQVITSKDSGTQFGYTTISGTIVDKNAGTPIIGAAVRIKGTNKSTVTDVNGNFAMKATGKKETLDIAYIGYQPRQVSVKGGDSLKVELNQDNAALSEVVTVGYGSRKNNDDESVSVVNAHPRDGTGSLKKYLQANAFVSGDEVAGTVSVTFTVNNDGSLSDFKIKKGISPATDQKAIDLVKAGPAWVGNSTGRPEQVTVKVKFVKK
ncbi:MAG TPA: carboxypeptidase-like regulatory domain-containing protein, partial [Mucilaginibacter sp.]